MKQKHQTFCEAYLLSGNAADAARKAGYSEKCARSVGQRLLTYADIKEYLEQRNAEIRAANTADMEEVRQFWTSTMRSTGAKDADRLKASELLAKTYGAFLERAEVQVGAKSPFEELTEDELRALAQFDGEW